MEHRQGVANRSQRNYGIYDHRLVPIFDAVQNDILKCRWLVPTFDAVQNNIKQKSPAAQA